MLLLLAEQQRQHRQIADNGADQGERAVRGELPRRRKSTQLTKQQANTQNGSTKQHTELDAASRNGVAGRAPEKDMYGVVDDDAERDEEDEHGNEVQRAAD